MSLKWSNKLNFLCAGEVQAGSERLSVSPAAWNHRDSAGERAARHLQWGEEHTHWHTHLKCYDGK